MKKKQKTLLIVGGLILVIIGLFFWSRSSTPAVTAYWGDTDIACLRFGHQNLSFHIHPHLTIFVDGAEETLPQNIGITPGCMAEMHTHDATGELHLESASAGRTFTVTDFFSVWDRSIERSGYTQSALVNGAVVDDIGSYTLKDNDRVVITYTSEANN